MPRFVILVQASADVEAGKMPPPETMKAVGEYHESLAKSGKLIWADGFLPSGRDAARVQLTASGPQVTNGPFQDPNTVVSGYWVINAADFKEALDIVKGTPVLHEGVWLELRRMVGPEDIEGQVPPEAFEKMKEMRDLMTKNAAALHA